MKIILVIQLLLALWKKFNYIADTNNLKLEAESAYQIQEYNKAISIYTTLTKEYEIHDEALILNLAHCYFKINDTANAKAYYSELISANNLQIRSISNQQLGILTANNGQLKKSMAYFKQAIIADASNEVARFNYELIKKYNDAQSSLRTNRSTPLILASDKSNNTNIKGANNSINNEESSKEQELNSHSQPSNARQPLDKQKQELEKSSQGSNEISNLTTQKRLQEMNLSQEKARKLLETMKREEIQYLQQKQKQINSEPGKPDW